ncbi:hypothetical protein [Nostoc sp. ChiQUE01b]|uniref:hypothetical protein n=1 Tax=Nostoc sp. ChiQUE01b TaxID=3075376 RepID=UPI002AD4EE9F|nr:hypothetical protein [Nostoc sp. ChiQUE01b]MDZ8261860.1 hypothetical protein [Nostoc sp. ChiQUE01b]
MKILIKGPDKGDRIHLLRDWAIAFIMLVAKCIILYLLTINSQISMNNCQILTAINYA